MASKTAPTPEEQSALADGLKIAAGFQREIFRTQESRLTGIDALGAIVVAGSIAIATFTGGLMKSETPSVVGLVITGVACLCTVAVALYARQERPRWIYPEAMEAKGHTAEQAVADLQKHVRDTTLRDSTTAARLEFDAWYSLSESIHVRRKVKGVYFVFAVVLLLAEVAAALYTAALS